MLIFTFIKLYEEYPYPIERNFSIFVVWNIIPNHMVSNNFNDNMVFNAKIYRFSYEILKNNRYIRTAIFDI